MTARELIHFLSGFSPDTKIVIFAQELKMDMNLADVVHW